MYSNDFENYKGTGYVPDPLYPDDGNGKEKKKSVGAAQARYESWLGGLGKFGQDNSAPKPETFAPVGTGVLRPQSMDKGMTPGNDGKVSDSFKKTFYNVMAPEATPERRMKLYSQSDRAINDALDGEFMDGLKERYRENRRKSGEKVRTGIENAFSVVGANPELLLPQAISGDDPVGDIVKTLDKPVLNEIVDRVAPLIRHSGIEAGEFMDNKVAPKVYNELYDEAVEEAKPKSHAEYIVRSALENSLIGKMSTLKGSMWKNTYEKMALGREAMGRFDSTFVDDVVAGVGSLLVDAPVFSMLGAPASAAATPVKGRFVEKVAEQLSGRIITNNIGRKIAREEAMDLARRIMQKQLSSKIVYNSVAQGVTLGGYDLAHSLVDSALEREFEPGKWTGAFTKGALTGAALGMVSTPLSAKAARAEGWRRAFAKSGVLCSESAVFTAASGIDGLLHGAEISPIDLAKDYASGTATLLSMRLAKWRPKGAAMKLDSNGKIKRRFRFSEAEAAELENLNVDAGKLMSDIEASLKMPSLVEKNNSLMETYSKVMASEELSSSAKSKLMLLVESKITSTPPVPFGYDVSVSRNGNCSILFFDAAGKKISTEYVGPAESVESRLILHKGNLRANRIMIFEDELTGGVRSVNFLRQAGLYAKEKGIDVDQISELVYNKAFGKPMTKAEEKVISEIAGRTMYDSEGMVQLLHDTRCAIEDKYDLKRGELMVKVNESFFMVKPKYSNALDEYEAFLRSEVEALKSGADPARAESIKKLGADGALRGMTNAEVKNQEMDEYNQMVERENEGRHNGVPKPPPAGYVMKVVQREGSPYLWSGTGARNTKEDIERYKVRVQEMGKKLGVNIEVISDVREIPLPDPNDRDAVNTYNTNLIAEGWNNLRRVVVNLPNIKSMEELERTVLHETVGHYGLLGIFGFQMSNFLENVLRKASPEVLAGIERMENKYKGRGKYVAVEEYLAHLAEGVSLTPKERGVYARVKEFVRNALVRSRLFTGSNRFLTEADLTEIMQRHCEYMMKRASGRRHRQEVFGDFGISHKAEKHYMDRKTYMKDVRELIDKGVLLPRTHRYLRNTNGFIHAEYMPEEQRAKVLMRYYNRP